jgi:hypothetical protein
LALHRRPDFATSRRRSNVASAESRTGGRQREAIIERIAFADKRADWRTNAVAQVRTSLASHRWPLRHFAWETRSRALFIADFMCILPEN